MQNYKNKLWGIIFITLGLIFGLNALEITNINIFFDGWWTLIIIVPCFIGLFSEKDKTGNMIGLLIGLSLLLICQEILEFEILWKLLFPVILILIGLSFIFKDKINRSVNEKIKELNKNKNQEEMCATFSEQNIDFDNEEFKGCDLVAVFGSVNCDLRNCIIKADQVINVNAIFGGVDIFVPKDVKVKVKSSSIFGGISNKKNNKKEDALTIYINATCIFGGVEIK